MSNLLTRPPRGALQDGFCAMQLLCLRVQNQLPPQQPKCIIIPEQPICSAFTPSSMVIWSLNKLHPCVTDQYQVQTHFCGAPAQLQGSAGTAIAYGHQRIAWHKSEHPAASRASGDSGSSHRRMHAGYTLPVCSVWFTPGYETTCGLHFD